MTQDQLQADQDLPMVDPPDDDVDPDTDDNGKGGRKEEPDPTKKQEL